MTVLQVLVRARKLIARGWCQGYEALNKDGQPVDCTDSRAAVFCAIGAITCAAHLSADMSDDPGAASENALLKAARIGSISDWNDAPRRTKKQVLVAFDKAIRKARAES